MTWDENAFSKRAQTHLVVALNLQTRCILAVPCAENATNRHRAFRRLPLFFLFLLSSFPSHSQLSFGLGLGPISIQKLNFYIKRRLEQNRRKAHGVCTVGSLRLTPRAENIEPPSQGVAPRPRSEGYLSTPGAGAKPRRGRKTASRGVVLSSVS